MMFSSQLEITTRNQYAKTPLECPLTDKLSTQRKSEADSIGLEKHALKWLYERL